MSETSATVQWYEARQNTYAKERNFPYIGLQAFSDLKFDKEENGDTCQTLWSTCIKVKLEKFLLIHDYQIGIAHIIDDMPLISV